MVLVALLQVAFIADRAVEGPRARSWCGRGCEVDFSSEVFLLDDLLLRKESARTLSAVRHCAPFSGTWRCHSIHRYGELIAFTVDSCGATGDFLLSHYSFFDPEEYQKRFGCSLKRSDNSPPAGVCIRAKEKFEGSVKAPLLFALPRWLPSVVPSKEVGL